MRLFRVASNRGNRKAPFDIAQMYETGLGVEVDKAEALKWYQVAAKREFAPARAKIKELGGEDSAAVKGATPG
jgi:TPR repeat protein